VCVWAANLFALASDLFPKQAVASVVALEYGNYTRLDVYDQNDNLRKNEAIAVRKVTEFAGEYQVP
jgi:hypothetical protein